MLREKIVASASHKFIVIVDETKLVNQLGKFPLPVEVIPFGVEITKRKIEELGCRSRIRMQDGRKYITDNGNYILDCEFRIINKPEELNQYINTIPGVVDNGLFIKMAHKVIVGYQDGKIKTIDNNI